MGRTRVICTASMTPGVPTWRQGGGLGWLTAEYGMLPASTGRRRKRPVLKQDGRSVEIQRLIGRVLRSVVQFGRLGENTIYLDCDVLEADGGTRTAAVTGAYVALARAIAVGADQGLCGERTLSGVVAAVSVGVVAGSPVLDLDYHEDAAADVDMNVAMTGGGKFIELQGTAERNAFSMDELQVMLGLARKGIRKLMAHQREAIAEGRS